MDLIFIFVGAFLFHSIQCDSGSFESSFNGIELSPFYDTIIYSDIADIIKEFESNTIPLFDKLAKDESESEENVEDLLSEYQKYLEKEHKQRKDYVERNKLKNKVPLLRHERYSKTSFGNGGKYNDYLYKNGYYNFDTYKSKSPLDIFIPISPKVQTSTPPRNSMELNSFKKILLNEANTLPTSTFPKFPFKAPCCKNGQMSCKQCNAQELSQNRLEPRVSLYSDEKNTDTVNQFVDIVDPDDALNIRIKIDVQLPKLSKLEKHKSRDDFDLDDGSNTKDFPLAIKMPTSYYNFPIPMNLFGYKRVSKLNSSPLHKITVHKKKKSKSNSSKKHKKKIITFHNIKLAPQEIYEAHFGKPNVSEGAIIKENNNSTDAPELETTKDILETNFSSISTTPFEDHQILNKTEVQTEENIFLLVNISNNVVKDTGERNKTNNSIETEYTNSIFNATTEKSLHFIKKRDVASLNKTIVILTKVIEMNKTELQAKLASKVIKSNKESKKTDIDGKKTGKNDTKTGKNSSTKNDKNFPNEEELLYWPNQTGSPSKIISKNITTIILDSENKKAKINMTKETMTHNHTRILEKAIFGDVDWKDVDTVAPAFLSFIGKYIEGTITFCSDSICHSMKCGQKVCYHRVCAPKDRLNNKGHCTGANNTDSVATMESIMDLPSNVAFEVVDILLDKMAGMIFGKVTLCINSKCITFAASKKLFIKYKCTFKELNPKGHCVNSKEGKVA